MTVVYVNSQFAPKKYVKSLLKLIAQYVSNVNNVLFLLFVLLKKYVISLSLV